MLKQKCVKCIPLNRTAHGAHALCATGVLKTFRHLTDIIIFLLGRAEACFYIFYLLVILCLNYRLGFLMLASCLFCIRLSTVKVPDDFTMDKCEKGFRSVVPYCVSVQAHFISCARSKTRRAPHSLCVRSATPFLEKCDGETGAYDHLYIYPYVILTR